MDILLGLIVTIAICKIPKAIIDYKLSHYNMDKVDIAKMNLDMVNGVSAGERRMRCISGYYDMDKK